MNHEDCITPTRLDNKERQALGAIFKEIHKKPR